SPQANENGDWQLPLTQDLYPPQTPLGLAEYTAAGAVASDWTEVTLTIASTALPAGSAPTLTSPTTVDTLRPLLQGKAAAYALVRVYLKGGAVLFGSPQANENGDWQLPLTQDLYPPQTPLGLAEYTAAGAVASDWTEVTLTIASTALPAGSAPTLTSPTTVDTLRPLLQGKATAYATVRVYFDGEAGSFDTAYADQNGDWQVLLGRDLYTPQTTLSMAEYDAADLDVSDWTSVTLTVTDAAPEN
ncbi:hypothetical protein OOJ97_17230, partial [Pseudomonas sp. 15FMM3]